MPFEVHGREKDVQLGNATYALVKARGDGNCLFHAAGHALSIAGLLGAQQQEHAGLRAHVVQYIADNARATNALGYKLREGLGVALNQQAQVSAAQGAAIDRRVAYLRQAGSWGDEACLTAIERLYDVEIEVYDDQGRDAPDNIRYYDPSHQRQTKLRLCVRLVGHVPYHYDVFVDPYDADRDGGNRAAAPPRKGGEVAQSAKEPWAYHLDPRGLRMFGPALGQRQFAYSRSVIDALGRKKVIQRSVAAALGDQANSVERAAPVVAVHVRNRSEDQKASLITRSLSARSKPEDLATAIEEPLFLPLARVDGSCVNLLDLQRSDLLVDVERGEAPQPARLRLRIYGRSFGRLAGKSGGGGLIAEMDLDLARLKPEVEALSAPDRDRYTLPLSAALPPQTAQLLTWEASPFQIVVSSDAELDPDQSAWTHVHVPSEWDVNVAERLARVPVIMLDDSPTALEGLGVGAKVGPLANPGIPGDPVEGREGFAIPENKEAALGQLAQAAGLGALDFNGHNYVIEVADGEWYASTSWASMVSLKLDPGDGRYYLHALYWSGDKRRAYRVSAADLAQPNQRAQAQRVGELDRVSAALWSTIIELRKADDHVRLHHQTIPALRAKDHYKSQWVFSSAERAEYGVLTEYEARYSRARAAIDQLVANQEVRRVLTGSDFKLAIDELKLPPLNDSVAMPAFVGLANLASGRCAEIRGAVLTARAALVQKGLPIEPEEVEGVKDFDLIGGKRLPPGNDWRRHVFDPPLKLAHAVTQGISSCAGGLTFSTEEVPEHVLMWHLDANLSIPVLDELERLWPEGKGAPELRTLALVTPSPWELNKYRLDNLYQASTVGSCESVFLARGAHWFGDQPVVAGCDLFGVDVREPRRIDLVFTYDIDKQTPALAPWSGLAADSEDTPVVLSHFRGHLFGTYRYEGADPQTPEAMAKYLGQVTSQEKQVQDAIKRHKRKSANKSCRIPGVNAEAFATIAQSAKPLLETDRAFAVEKGDADLAMYRYGRWTPGSRASK